MQKTTGGSILYIMFVEAQISWLDTNLYVLTQCSLISWKYKTCRRVNTLQATGTILHYFLVLQDMPWKSLKVSHILFTFFPYLLLIQRWTEITILNDPRAHTGGRGREKTIQQCANSYNMLDLFNYRYMQCMTLIFYIILYLYIISILFHIIIFILSYYHINILIL